MFWAKKGGFRAKMGFLGAAKVVRDATKVVRGGTEDGLGGVTESFAAPRASLAAPRNANFAQKQPFPGKNTETLAPAPPANRAKGLPAEQKAWNFEKKTWRRERLGGCFGKMAHRVISLG